jgi:hypothetical protein
VIFSSRMLAPFCLQNQPTIHIKNKYKALHLRLIKYLSGTVGYSTILEDVSQINLSSLPIFFTRHVKPINCTIKLAGICNSCAVMMNNAAYVRYAAQWERGGNNIPSPMASTDKGRTVRPGHGRSQASPLPPPHISSPCGVCSQPASRATRSGFVCEGEL